jgi:hypothetical protein
MCPTCTLLLASAIYRAARRLSQRVARQAEPRPVLLVLYGGGAHASSLAAGSHPDDRNRPASTFLSPYVANVCFKCFICLLQLLHMDVAKVDRDAAYFASIFSVTLQAF